MDYLHSIFLLKFSYSENHWNNWGSHIKMSTSINHYHFSNKRKLKSTISLENIMAIFYYVCIYNTPTRQQIVSHSTKAFHHHLASNSNVYWVFHISSSIASLHRSSSHSTKFSGFYSIFVRFVSKFIAQTFYTLSK